MDIRRIGLGIMGLAWSGVEGKKIWPAHDVFVKCSE
jgi:hypothetical protein